MKKILSIFLILCLISIFAAGCSDKGTSETGSNSPEIQGSTNSVAENSSPEIQESANSAAESNSPKSQDSTAAAGGLDVDLTVMSSTMVYAEVYNMMKSPDDYIGKTVKMRGSYYASCYEKTDKYYHYVIIEDAAACCQQGLEFIWNGDHIYPDDYPEDDTIIEVTGIFGSYEEAGYIYYYLAVDEMSILE